jgi:hypothetical protein
LDALWRVDYRENSRATAWLNYMPGNKPDGGFHHGACGSLPLRTLEQLKAETEKAVRALAKELEAATIQSA